MSVDMYVCMYKSVYKTRLHCILPGETEVVAKFSTCFILVFVFLVVFLFLFYTYRYTYIHKM